MGQDREMLSHFHLHTLFTRNFPICNFAKNAVHIYYLQSNFYSFTISDTIFSTAANASSSMFKFFAPAIALSGLPPPFPPAICATCLQFCLHALLFPLLLYLQLPQWLLSRYQYLQRQLRYQICALYFIAHIAQSCAACAGKIEQ